MSSTVIGSPGSRAEGRPGRLSVTFTSPLKILKLNRNNYRHRSINTLISGNLFLAVTEAFAAASITRC